jgi:hypothetical protein
MVFPFKHPLGWFLLLAALGLVGCNDEATTPETLHTEPYRTPPVACNEGRSTSSNNIPSDTPVSPGDEPAYVQIVDKETNKPMAFEKMQKIVPVVDPIKGGGIRTQYALYADECTDCVDFFSFSAEKADGTGLLISNEAYFMDLGDSSYVNIHFYFKDEAPERLRIMYYNKGFEPDSCYRLYYFHNDTLVYKGNDHRIHYPALHIDY